MEGAAAIFIMDQVLLFHLHGPVMSIEEGKGA
jgi:hypothetical protein